MNGGYFTEAQEAFLLALAAAHEHGNGWYAFEPGEDATCAALVRRGFAIRRDACRQARITFCGLGLFDQDAPGTRAAILRRAIEEAIATLERSACRDVTLPVTRRLADALRACRGA